MTGCILSAGEQRRWGSHGAKQLSVVYGEPLMARQLRQFRAHGIEPLIIAWRRDILDWPSNCVDVSKPTPSLVHTLLLTEPYWGNRTILLNGDVFVFDPTFEALISDPSPLRFWMNESEVYALTFFREQAQRLHDAAWHVRHQNVPHQLRTVYRHLLGLPLDGPLTLVPTVLSGAFVNSCTGMFDIDSPRQLRNYVKR